MGKPKHGFAVIALALLGILAVWILTIAFYLALIGGALWLLVNLLLKPLGLVV